MKYNLLFLIGIVFFWGCSDKQASNTQPSIIPIPNQLELKKGSFRINGRTDIVFNSDNDNVKALADGLKSKLSAFIGKELKTSQLEGTQSKNSILLNLDETLNGTLGKEGYKMSVESSGIEISAPEAAGLFYGVQSLYQLLPAEIYGDPSEQTGKETDLTVPCIEITDYPEFSWRGMHLDVSRHFFPKEFVKKYIDLIALHKMNVFHWHLTDDNGWRIEIDKYPLLTEVAAWRADREDMPWDNRTQQRSGEKATYGGFYTKEDIREIVAYAKERFVTVIPEIEMPGHSSEVFAAYPEYSCTGKRTTVQTGSYWPNTEILCAGKEGTFTFIEDVLDEVAELFPSEYIHIGGDEADKTAWRNCPNSQARIRQEGLDDEKELQSYFVKRVEKYLKSKGKKLIGWDEILQGGLPLDATVMSWQGFEGGIEAAMQGHQVVMCPTSYCYFDYYQADPDFQLPAFNGLITLKKVYAFHPVPAELQGGQRELILGGQGNLWTEYIPTTSQAEYMALPRMTALAEVLWSPESKRNWDDFSNRLQVQFKRFDNLEVNYSQGSARVEANAIVDLADKPYAIQLSTEIPGAEIYYTMNGNAPDQNSFIYKNPVKIEHDVKLKAIAYKDGKPLERFAEYKVSINRITGKQITYQRAFSERYPAGGINALNDGLRGSLNFNDGYWQGFNGSNMDVVIDMGENSLLNSVSASFLLDQKKWIFMPDHVNFYVSGDGENYQQIASVKHNVEQNTKQALINDFSAKLNRPMQFRYLRVEAMNIWKCPDWHPGKGQKAWIFIDEIIVK
jgi:hexosaminidase